MLTTRRAFAVVLTIAAAGGGYVAVRTAQTPRRAPDRPAWTEIAWPFASHQWGRGRAFRCRAAAWGSEIDLYLRAKIGFCNCVSAIDDEEVDGVADFDLMGRDHAALAPGGFPGSYRRAPQGFDGRQGAAAPGQPPTQQRAALLESVLTEVSRYSIGRAPDLRLAT